MVVPDGGWIKIKGVHALVLFLHIERDYFLYTPCKYNGVQTLLYMFQNNVHIVIIYD